MDYQLHEKENLSIGIKRIAYEQIDAALQYLQNPEEDWDVAVHESRKCFKKLRGLLRLVRMEIGQTIYKRENACFRDAGRLLSDMRDSCVKIELLNNQIDIFQDGANNEAFAGLKDALHMEYEMTRQRVIVEENAPAQVIDMIEAARGRVNDWPITDNSFAAVVGGLHKVYRRGCNRRNDALHTPGVENLHEWRKRVKYLWYNIRILHPIWPDVMKSLADEIHELADYLGDEHDLAVLRALLLNRPTLFRNQAARMSFISHLDRQRAGLQQRAFNQGRLIYAESPDKFVDRLSEYWAALN